MPPDLDSLLKEVVTCNYNQMYTICCRASTSASLGQISAFAYYRILTVSDSVKAIMKRNREIE